MTDLDDAAAPVDGRVARKQRNVDAVLDVVLELFAEESMFPTIEQAATRSGLSLRSLYRYFADPSELLEATIRRSRQQTADIAHLPAIGEGPFEQRLDDLVDSRLRIYEARGPVYRATVANAARHPRVQAEMARNVSEMRAQFEKQFAPEIKALKPLERLAAISAGDLVTQIGSIDHLRRHGQLSVAETKDIVATAVRSVLNQGV